MSEQNLNITRMIPLSRVTIAQNVRTSTGLDKDSLAELAASIRTHGLLQPIIVAEHEGGYAVIAGQRRTLASEIAGLTEVPAIVRGADTPGEELKAAQIVENLHRENLGLAETCAGVREMLAMVGKPAEVAKRLNKSSAWVSKHLSPTGPTFSKTVRELVTSGGCHDIETALMLNQISKHKGAGESLAAILTMKVSKGLMGRAGVKAELDKLREPANDGNGEDGEGSGEGSGEGAAPSGKKTISFELSDFQAALFDAMGGVAWIKRELNKAEKAQGKLPL